MQPVAKTGVVNDQQNSDINDNLQTDLIIVTFANPNQANNLDHIDAGFRKPIPTSLLGWGGNYAGGLGTGSPSSTPSPLPVLNSQGVKKVLNNGSTTVILKNNGEVWTVGMNNCGWLGNGQYTNSDYCGSNNGSPIDTSTPTKITFGNNLLIKDIAQTFAIDQNGNVWGWTIECINGKSPLENGCDPNINPGVPRRVLSAPGVPLANIVSFNANSIKSPTVYKMDEYNYNRGLFKAEAYDTTAQSWDLFGDYTKASVVNSLAPGGFAWNLVDKTSNNIAGNYTLLKDGRLFEIVNNAPVQVKPGTTFKDVAVSRHVLALETDGRVWAKGFNICGQLGIGGAFRPVTTTNQSGNIFYSGCWDMGSIAHEANPPVNDFVLVKDAAGTGVLSNIKSVSVNNLQSMAVTNDGQIYVWGGDYSGIGHPTIRQTGLPILIPGVNKVQQIVSNMYHNFLIVQD